MKGETSTSHSADFFGNDRTTGTASEATLENATVNLASEHDTGSVGTFYLQQWVMHHFVAGQKVRVEGVSVAGWNGLWTVPPPYAVFTTTGASDY